MMNLELIGIYSAPVSPKVRARIEQWIPDADLARREVEDLVYVDFEIKDAVWPVTVSEFGQKGTTQAAWRERWFRPGSFDPIEMPPISSCFRLCFFLHYFSRHEPIRSPCGDFWWEDPPAPAPPELVEAHPYVWPWA